MHQDNFSPSELINLRHWAAVWILSVDKPTVEGLKNTAVNVAKILNPEETSLIDEIIRDFETRGFIAIEDGTIIPKSPLKAIARQALKAISRVHWTRNRARRILRAKKHLTAEDWAQLLQYLETYIAETSQKVIVLKNLETGELILLHYSHRFLIPRLLSLEDDLKTAFEIASQKYKTAVFITLTMDPKRCKSIAHAIRMGEKAWARFYKYITDLAEARGIAWDYIRVTEAQDNGFPHYHIVIFGFNRIEDHFKLTPRLTEMGFGQVHFEYKLVNRDGKWTWSRSKPQDARDDDVKDYLRKYLRKAIMGFIHATDGDPDISKAKTAWYFASNKRFFTTSRGLRNPSPSKKPSGTPLVVMGTHHWTEVEDLYGITLAWDPTTNTWGRVSVHIKY